MKKFFLSLTLAILALTGIKAQTTSTPAYRNALLGGFSYEIATNNSQYYTYSLEYTRHIKGRLYWGVTASFRNSMGMLAHYDIDCEEGQSCPDPYRNSISLDVPTLTGMFYYEFPVIGHILALRGGAGIGLGYHIARYEDAELYGNKFSPYLTLKLQWIVRPVERLEIALAPLIVGPSAGSAAPWVWGAPSDKKILAHTNLINIQVGYRF